MVLGSLFGGGGPQLRPMERKDLGAVLRIIHQHDEDDFEEARAELQEDVEGMLVYTKGGKVVGVTGASDDPYCEDIVWLSWTYVDVTMQDQGIGKEMFDSLTGMLRQSGIRKLFINTSDYQEDGKDIYAAAKAFYEQMGAQLEVRLPDYHAPGEARYTYGLNLAGEPKRDEHPGGGCLRFTGIEEMPESENGWGLLWDEVEGQHDPAMVDSNLAQHVAEARSRGARILVAAVPSDLCANLNGPLQETGFEHHGRLLDFFGPNIHQELGLLRLS